MRRAPAVVILLVAPAALAGCRVEHAKDPVDSAALAASAAAARAATLANAPTRGASVTGFKGPESVRYDADLDMLFVSNTNGDELAKDNNGFISRLRGDGSVDSMQFIAGGRGGVTLHSPHGSVIIGDTIWVADIDAMRAFNKRTGAVVATVDLRQLGAVFLNDVAAAPDGALYITDTGPDGKSTATKGNRIFRVGRDHKASVALHSDSLQSPNGITWDERGRRFIIVQWGGKRILAWHPGDTQPRTIGFGAGESDGVEVLADGRLVFTSWADSAVIVHHDNEETIVKGLPSPADFAVDPRRHRLVIPLMEQDRIEFWDVPPLTP